MVTLVLSHFKTEYSRAYFLAYYNKSGPECFHIIILLMSFFFNKVFVRTCVELINRLINKEVVFVTLIRKSDKVKHPNIYTHHHRTESVKTI